MKVIFYPVGDCLTNDPNDVMTVQYLLNCVPIKEGGPYTKFRLDGRYNFSLQMAIGVFQQTQFLPVDLLVIPFGFTIRRLVDFDPTPDLPLAIVLQPPNSPPGVGH